VRHSRTRWQVPEEQDVPLAWCEGPHATLQELWPQLRGPELTRPPEARLPDHGLAARHDHPHHRRGPRGQVGEALARAFADAGARLALVDRDAEQVEARAAALRATGAEAHAAACDLTDPAGGGRRLRPAARGGRRRARPRSAPPAVRRHRARSTRAIRRRSSGSSPST
jgi:hypothetical protein